MLFNVQNLFIGPYTIKRDYPLPYSKNLEKVNEIAKVILKENPDIIMLTEVGGEDSLINFNKSFLDDQYIPSLIMGNSDRGIELGYLIKKSLPFAYEQYTHKNRKLDFNYPNETELDPKPIHYLSRDIAELRFYNSEEDKKTPCLIILLVHLKSKLDKDGLDHQGTNRRQAEFSILVDTYNVLNTRYDNKVPIFLAGDFNGNASNIETDREFKKIYNDTQLLDVMELAKVEPEERFSFIHFPDHYTGLKQQLDYIFIPQNLENIIDKKRSGAYRFRDQEENLITIPTNRSILYTLPSDHYPVFLKLKNFLNID